jgi:hypothetical protein
MPSSASSSTGAAPRSSRGHVAEEQAELVHHDQAAPATVHVVGHDRQDRLRRAMLGLGACWGAAILAVFLPLLHFVLVPALVVAGPLVALSQLRQRVTVLDVDGPCPACGAPIREKLMSDSRLPMALRCESCRRALSVRLPAHLLDA